MAEDKGLEPLSYALEAFILATELIFYFGAPTEIRTLIGGMRIH